MAGADTDLAQADQIQQAQKITEFWQNFLAIAPVWVPLSQWEWVETANAWLENHWPGIAFETLASEESDDKKLILTANGNIDHFPLLLELVRRAPALPGYQLEAFRSRTPLDEFSMRMDNFELSTAEVLISHYADHGQVGLQVGFAKIIPESMQEHARNMAFIMLDHVIGEYDLAVKVGCIDFVSDAASELNDPELLSQFTPIFDRFWVNDLGHSGIFPAEEHEWRGLEVRFSSNEADEEEEQEDKAFVTWNESANAVAMRADLVYCLTLSLPTYDSASLEAAQTVHDRLAHQLAVMQSGIMAYTLWRAGWRHAMYYVSDAESAHALALSLLSPLQQEEFDLQSKADFSWSSYLQFSD